VLLDVVDVVDDIYVTLLLIDCWVRRTFTLLRYAVWLLLLRYVVRCTDLRLNTHVVALYVATFVVLLRCGCTHTVDWLRLPRFGLVYVWLPCLVTRYVWLVCCTRTTLRC